MTTEQEKEIIRLIETMFCHMQVALTSVSVETDERINAFRFNILTPDDGLFLKENGERLHALNHLFKRIVEGKMKDFPASIVIDINDFQKKYIEDIRAKAHMLGERARYFKSAVDMDPMSPYERMIVHAEFTDSPDLSTESVGVGLSRHIVIRYHEKE